LISLTTKELERENIGIERDDLILTIVVADRTRANVFLAMHQKGILRKEEIRESDIYATYWYTSELAVFNMRNNKKMKEKHGVKEHLLIIALEDVASSPLIRW
jgi:hypothetical protein